MTVCASFLTVLVLSTLVLTGCASGSGGNFSAVGSYFDTNANNPLAKIQVARNPANATSSKEAGLIELVPASELLTMTENPFLAKLPELANTVLTNLQPEEEKTDDNADKTKTEAAKLVDPFEQVSLKGIMYSAKNPLALLRTHDMSSENIVGQESSGRQSGAEDSTTKTVIVKPQEVFTVGIDQFKAVKITTKTVVLKYLSEGNLKNAQKTFTMASLVGYRNEKDKAADDKTNASDTSTSTLESLLGGSTSTSMSANNTGLDLTGLSSGQIKSLAEGAKKMKAGATTPPATTTTSKAPAMP